MTTADAWNYSAPANATRPADGWGARTRYAPEDFVTLLWRERVLMLVVFAVIFIIGLGLAFVPKTTYTANSSLIVQLGQEYVYNPLSNDAARGAIPDIDQVVATETEILGSDEVKDLVLQELGVKAVYPDLGKAYDRGSPSEKAEILAKARQAMGRSLGIDHAVDQPIIRVSFEHENPATAAKVLNTVIDKYLLHRRAVVKGPDAPAIQAQRFAFEEQLAAADAEYQAFLGMNGIGDFETEKSALNQSLIQLQQRRFDTESQLSGARGQLSAWTGQLASLPAQAELYRDDNMEAANQLEKLRQERAELLGGGVRAESSMVAQINDQIAALESAVRGGLGRSPSARRTGPNPVHQTSMAERSTAEARVADLSQSRATLSEQIATITRRQQELAALEPRFQDIARRRASLQQVVNEYTVREQQAQAADAGAGKGADTVRRVERASPPNQGKSLKKPIAILALLVAGFTALCVGLLRIFTRPGIPTPTAAGRTLDLPVLGYASVKKR